MKGLPRLAFWLLAAALIAGIAVLYRFSSHLDHANLLRVQVDIEELQSIDIAANLDVLKLKQRHLADYDSLVTASTRVQELLAHLEPEFRRVGLAGALLPVRQAWEEKAAALERFKQYSAILSNSHYHFANLATQFANGGAGSQLDLFNRRLLVFMVQGESDDVPELSQLLAAVSREVEGWPPVQRSSGRLLVSHGGVILSHHLLVRGLSDQILGSPFPARVDEAFAAYNGAFARAGEVAESYRTAMAAFAVLLIAIVLFVTLRLRESSRQLARSHRLLDNIADTLGEGIVAFSATGQLAFINRRGQELLGGSEDELIGQSAERVLFAGREGSHDRALLTATTAGQPLSGEATLTAGDGRRFPAAYTGAPLVAGERGNSGYVLSFRDLSEARSAEARLHLAAHVFDSLSEAMVITDIDGRIQSVNPAFSTITGFSEEEALGKRPGQLLASGQHEPAFFREMWGALQSLGKWQGEITNRRKNGELYTEWLSISAVRDGSGATIQYIGLFTDITERKEAEAYIHHLAYHDSLTGLANRLLFIDRLETALRQSHRGHRHLAVLMFDLDRFKVVNDTLGHQTGDRLLKEVANRIKECIREGDTLARLGGDEFALLMPEVRSAVDAANVAHKLLGALARPMQLDNKEVFATTSIGIAVYPTHGATGGQLLKNADVALYAAKNAGRNTYRFFNPDETQTSGDKLDLEIGLRHALARQQLFLYYQLQVDAHSGAVSGVEALIRWQHPERGLVPPDRFIPLAEETGLIEEIGAWCLETACSQLVRWQSAGVAIPRVAVNVSARQLRFTDFAGRLMDVIERTGIDPACLELELTESMLTHDTEHIFSLFSDLRQRGIRIAIDDFGTGYSSLNYLAQYPVDVIKVDRSFVRKIEEDNEAPYVVQAVVQLARGLKMETVAEGVETDGQRLRLMELGCDHLQGFLFARPCPPAAIPGLVQDFRAAATEDVLR